MRSWNPDLLRKPWDMVASEHRWLQSTMNVYRSSPMHLFDVQAFWLMTWWCQAIFGMSWADWWTDSCVGADTGSRRENHKDYAFFGTCSLPRATEVSLRISRLWYAMIPYNYTDCQREAVHGKPQLPILTQSDTPFPKKESKHVLRLCAAYLLRSNTGLYQKIICFAETHLMADVCLIWLHPLILQIYNNGIRHCMSRPNRPPLPYLQPTYPNS